MNTIVADAGAAAGANVVASPNSTATNTGTLNDSAGNSTVTLSASVGTVTQNDANGTWTWSLPVTTSPTIPTTVTISGTDTQGATAFTTFTYEVRTAGLAVQGDVYILNQTASGALNISGNAVLNVEGTLQVDSSSASAVELSGNASVNAAQTLIVGGDQTSGKAGFTQAPVTHDTGASVADPLAGLTAPTSGNSRPAVNLSNGTITIGPGAYPSITVSGNAHLILTPGVYVIGTGGITISGSATVTNQTDALGDGVLIYNNGALTVSGSAGVNLTASSTGIYADVAIFQARTDTSAVTVSGNAMLNLNGSALYDANTQSVVTVSGNAQVAAALVVNELTLSGNSDDTAQ